MVLVENQVVETTTVTDKNLQVKIVHVEKKVKQVPHRKSPTPTYIARLTTHNLKTTLLATRTFSKKDHKRPTWNLPLHILVKTIKANIEYPHHDLKRMRKSMDMFGEPMIPKQVKITPFAFFVRRDVLLGYERRARRSESGFVVPEEGEEGGEYMLDGEWVEWVDKKDDKREGDGEERIILYLHGGAYILGSPKTHRSITYRIAKKTRAKIFVLNYRLCPEHAFPAAIHDAFAAYIYLTNPSHPAFHKPGAFYSPNTSRHQSVKPSSIVLMGDSAGAGLSAGLMVYLNEFLRDGEGNMMFEMVRGGVFMSPFVDMTCSTQSWLTNYNTDYLPKRPASILTHMFQGEPPTHPVNPVYSYLCGRGSHALHRLVATEGKVLDEMEYEAGHLEDLIGIDKPLMKRYYELCMVNCGGVRVGLTRVEKKNDRQDEREYKLTPDEEETMFLTGLHPLASPLFADVRGFPPCLIQNGDAEMVRDEGLLFAHRLTTANPSLHARGLIRHELYRDMPHVFQAIIPLRTSKHALKNMAAFIDSIFFAPVSETRYNQQGTHGIEDGLMIEDSFQRTSQGFGPLRKGKEAKRRNTAPVVMGDRESSGGKGRKKFWTLKRGKTF